MWEAGNLLLKTGQRPWEPLAIFKTQVLLYEFATDFRFFWKCQQNCWLPSKPRVWQSNIKSSDNQIIYWHPQLNSLVVVFTVKSYCANYKGVLLIVEVVDRKKHAKRRRGGTAAGLQPTCGFTQLSGALLYARACAYERVCREKSCPTKSGWTAGIEYSTLHLDCCVGLPGKMSIPPRQQPTNQTCWGGIVILRRFLPVLAFFLWQPISRMPIFFLGL